VLAKWIIIRLPSFTRFEVSVWLAWISFWVVARKRRNDCFHAVDEKIRWWSSWASRVDQPHPGEVCHRLSDWQALVEHL